MVCIFLNRDDASGKWLARSLRQVSAKPIQIITAEELVYATEFTCGFRNGQAFFSIQLHSGFSLCQDTISAVINRINFPELPHLSQFKPDDRDYVQMEFQAILSFLFSVVPNTLFNHSSGRGLSGMQRTATEWQLLAMRAGFEIIEDAGSETNFSLTGKEIVAVVVFQNKTYSTVQLSQATRESGFELLRLSGDNIIEVYLTKQNDQTFFIGATVQPSFAHVNEDFINDINNLL